MNRFIFLLVVAVCALAGCADLKSKIVGSWVIDLDTLKGPGLSNTSKNDPQFQQFFGQAKLELKKDGTYSLTDPGGVTQTGNWTLSNISVNLSSSGVSTASQPEIIVTDGGATLHLTRRLPQGNVEMDWKRPE